MPNMSIGPLGIDTIEKCLWILRKKFNFVTTSKLKVSEFQSLKLSLNALVEIKFCKFYLLIKIYSLPKNGASLRLTRRTTFSAGTWANIWIFTRHSCFVCSLAQFSGREDRSGGWGWRMRSELCLNLFCDRGFLEIILILIKQYLIIWNSRVFFK